MDPAILLLELKCYKPHYMSGNFDLTVLNKKIIIKNDNYDVCIIGVVNGDYLNVCITLLDKVGNQSTIKKGSLKIKTSILIPIFRGVMGSVAMWTDSDKEKFLACWIEENGRLPTTEEIETLFIIWMYSYISIVAASFWGWLDIPALYRHSEEADFMFYYPYMLYADLMLIKNRMSIYSDWINKGIGIGWHAYHPSREINPLTEYIAKRGL